jgi:dTDP-4-amino-4,6-dideoxygalactose transaminase
MRIPFAPPYISEAVISEVTETLRSGWITSGPRVDLLEGMMQEFTEMARCICVNSWTSGALLTLRWWGIQPGDEIIVPAYTYAATALVACHTGARPVMLDIGDDLTMDPEKLAAAINPRTKAVIPVDMGGWPCNYARIREVLEQSLSCGLFEPANERQRKLGRPLLLADAAHSLGATFNHLPAGLAADIAVYSLHAVKNITTAEGGVIGLNLPMPFDNKEVSTWMKLNRQNGQTRDALEKTVHGGWRYDIVSAGWKMNMPDLCAAVGIAQLKEYPDRLLPQRQRVAWRYHAALCSMPWAELPPLTLPGRTSAYHIFPICIRAITEAQRDRIIELMGAMGVSVNVHFIPLPMMSYFKGLGYSIQDVPVSYNRYAREITLPVYPQLTDEEVDYVVDALVRAYGQATHDTGNEAAG